jgi:hypothetical protein
MKQKIPPALPPIGCNIVDYFFIAGCSSDEVQVALKENISLDELSAIILDRFPEEERPFSTTSSEPAGLPLSAPIFCFPLGFNAYEEDSIEGKKTTKYDRSFHSFVLTDGSGTRSYGACLQFNERHTNGKVVAVVPKVLCVMSQYGYFSMYQKFLEAMYRTYVLGVVDGGTSSASFTASAPLSTSTNETVGVGITSPTSSIPAISLINLEAEIYRFVLGCSLPQPGYGIEYPLGIGLRSLRYSCSVGPPGGFPDVDDTCFRCLFDCLSAENLVFVVSAVLLEQRILLHSENLDTLNKCGEALIALLFPLCWQHVYVPLLPTQLLEYLSAPVPFIMGVHTSCLASQEGIESLPFSVVVHLDFNKVAPPMEVLLPGESGPVLKETDLPELPYELRMKIISKITSEVPGWKTSKLERSGTRSSIQMERSSRRRSTSSEKEQVDPELSSKGSSNSNNSSCPNNNNKNKNMLSVRALLAAREGREVDVKFGEGPVGLTLQSTKWIPVGDIFDTVGSAMVREFVMQETETVTYDVETDSFTKLKNGKIVIGSIIISINGISTAGATFTETMNQLRFCPRPMTLRFLVPPLSQDDGNSDIGKSSDTTLKKSAGSLTRRKSDQRLSTDDRDLNYSGSVSYRWVDKVRATFLEMMFVIFSGGVKVQQSFTDRMMSSFGRSKRSSMQSNGASPRLGSKTPITLYADYRKFLSCPTKDHAMNQKTRKLMKKKLVRAHPENMRKFMAVFVETQAFSNFIDDATQIKYHGQGSVGSGDEFSREAGIEILNQVLQTADINEGMLLDVICRKEDKPSPMEKSCICATDMCGVDELVRQKTEDKVEKDRILRLSNDIMSALKKANTISEKIETNNKSSSSASSDGDLTSSTSSTGTADAPVLPSCSNPSTEKVLNRPANKRRDWVRRTSQMINVVKHPWEVNASSSSGGSESSGVRRTLSNRRRPSLDMNNRMSGSRSQAAASLNSLVDLDGGDEIDKHNRSRALSKNALARARSISSTVEKFHGRDTSSSTASISSLAVISESRDTSEEGKEKEDDEKEDDDDDEDNDNSILDAIAKIEAERSAAEQSGNVFVPTPRNKNRRRSTSSPNPFRVSIDLFPGVGTSREIVEDIEVRSTSPTSSLSSSQTSTTRVIINKPRHIKNLSCQIKNFDEAKNKRKSNSSLSLSSLGIILQEECDDDKSEVSEVDSESIDVSFLHGHVDAIPNVDCSGEMKNE